MKILVTGGAGFIGSHVADGFLEEGHDVHVLDSFVTGREENVPEAATLHRLDVREEETANLFKREQFDVLVHHAAQMDVRKSVADPRFDADVNVMGLLNMMEAGKENGLKKVVFASTGGAIYGEPDYTPQDESHPTRPLSPYGITKLASEKYLFYYHKQYDVDYVALRYANIYGPRQNPHGEAGVVAIFTQSLLEDAQPVIYGDGEQTRDYVFVQDIVRANKAALDYDGVGVFNVGTARETSVNELFHHLKDITGANASEKHAEGRPGEQRRSVIGYEKAQDLLDWSPQVMIEEGLHRTATWFEQRAETDVAG